MQVLNDTHSEKCRTVCQAAASVPEEPGHSLEMWKSLRVETEHEDVSMRPNFRPDWNKNQPQGCVEGRHVMTKGDSSDRVGKPSYALPSL